MTTTSAIRLFDPSSVPPQSSAPSSLGIGVEQTFLSVSAPTGMSVPPKFPALTLHYVYCSPVWKQSEPKGHGGEATPPPWPSGSI